MPNSYHQWGGKLIVRPSSRLNRRKTLLRFASVYLLLLGIYLMCKGLFTFS